MAEDCNAEHCRYLRHHKTPSYRLGKPSLVRKHCSCQCISLAHTQKYIRGNAYELEMCI